MRRYCYLLGVLLVLALSISTVYAGPVAIANTGTGIAVPVNDSVNIQDDKLERGSAKKSRKKLTRKKRKGLRKELKERLRQGRDIYGFLLILIAIVVPPLAVAFYNNAFDERFWLCLLLWTLFYFPGLIYALLVILN